MTVPSSVELSKSENFPDFAHSSLKYPRLLPAYYSCFGCPQLFINFPKTIKTFVMTLIDPCFIGQLCQVIAGNQAAVRFLRYIDFHWDVPFQVNKGLSTAPTLAALVSLKKNNQFASLSTKNIALRYFPSR